jgi:hypothetical protein
MTQKIFKRIAAPTSAPTIVNCKENDITFPLSIAAHPGASGSLLVECSLHPNADVSGSGAVWFPWLEGDVVAATLGALASPVAAIRLTATTAAGVVELAC